MDTPLTVTREIETDLSLSELWSLIADGDRWAEWMVDEADVDVRAGAAGRVVDNGVERDVAIDDVDDDARVTFTWWPEGDASGASTVSLRVLPSANGSTLYVVETFPAVAGVLRTKGSARAWAARASAIEARSTMLLAA